MDEQQKQDNKITINQIFEEVKRSRHDRETLAELGKVEYISRENIRKIMAVDNSAPDIIKEAMGKGISIHKAYKINKYLQRMPEEEREAIAVWLLSKEIEERVSGINKEKRIAKKLSDVMTIARRYKKYLTDEAIDLYLKHEGSLLDAIDLLGDEIFLLSQLKLIFQKRRIKQEDEHATQNFGEGTEVNL